MSVPAGTVLPFATPTAPEGWLPCDWRVLSQTDSKYILLFNAIGTTYNEGNEGAGNFRIPDLRGRFIRGTGTDGSAGMSPGALGEKQDDGILQHSHTTNTYHLRQGLAGYQFRYGGSVPLSFAVGFTIGSNSGRSANETRPYNIVLLYCIKY